MVVIPVLPIFKRLKPSTAILNETNKITLPRFSNEVHHEIELALLVGKEAKSIKSENWKKFILKRDPLLIRKYPSDKPNIIKYAVISTDGTKIKNVELDTTKGTVTVGRSRKKIYNHKDGIPTDEFDTPKESGINQGWENLSAGDGQILETGISDRIEASLKGRKGAEKIISVFDGTKIKLYRDDALNNNLLVRKNAIPLATMNFSDAVTKGYKANIKRLTDNALTNLDENSFTFQYKFANFEKNLQDALPSDKRLDFDSTIPEKGDTAKISVKDSNGNILINIDYGLDPANEEFIFLRSKKNNKEDNLSTPYTKDELRNALRYCLA